MMLFKQFEGKFNDVSASLNKMDSRERTSEYIDVMTMIELSLLLNHHKLKSEVIKHSILHISKRLEWRTNYEIFKRIMESPMSDIDYNILAWQNDQALKGKF